MGALGCKYCNWNEENNEGRFEQFNKSNNPVLITNHNNNENNKNTNENNIININDIISNSQNEEKENNFKNFNLKISQEKDTIEKPEIINDNSEQNFNENKDNIIIEDNLSNNLEQNEEENINNINKLKSNLEKSNINQFSLRSKNEVKNKVKNYEINKINFGLKSQDKEKLNLEQKKLYKEAENNLQQFNAPQGDEISKLQIIMSNILYKLNKFFTSINLSSSNDDYKYILLNSSLNKMINYEINAHSTTMYSERFCVLYPKMFKYYRSKESFLKNLSPLYIIPINQISAVNIAKPKKGKKKLYHLIICNKLGIQQDSSNKKIFKNAFDSSSDTDESLLIFTSDDEKNVFQWYIVLQYLIEISKN